MKKSFLLLPAWLLAASLLQAQAPAKLSREGVEFFETKIRPVLVKECYECHSAQATKVRGGLLLDTAAGLLEGGDNGPAFVPGQPEKSLLLQSIRHQGLKMPPKEKLPAAIAADFEAWIRMGAPDPRTLGKKELEGLAFFETKVRPVFEKNCYECHSEQAKIVRANLYLDSRDGMLRGGDSGPVLVPGAADKSLILKALSHASRPKMPPKGKLPDPVLADLATWIDLGAPDPRRGKSRDNQGVDIEKGREFWAYQSPKSTKTPAVKDVAWPRTNIDRYLLASLEAKGLPPVADAPRELLLRRLSFDLTGLPPTVQEIDAFLADKSANALEKFVDRYLASPRFGERWGRHWLDVVRYGESSGRERNVPYRLAWRYRDYVIDAFNADMPFDQFVREQMAGDLLPHASVAEHDRHLIATGFLAIGSRALTERNEELYHLDVADEQLDVVSRALLASTVACARCHDHKFDPIPTSDYYALIGIFRSTENLAGVVPLQREFRFGDTAPLGETSVRDGPARELQQKIMAVEKEAAGVRNLIRDTNKKKDPALSAKVKMQEAEVMKRLADLRTAAESDHPSEPRFAMAVRDRAKVADCAIRIRGEVEDLGPIVPRGFLSVLKNANTPSVNASQSGRVELAEWIASKDNPLTARVFVNRLWHHLFGKGLVDSLDNFGSVGERPSHPELLDYLALRFMNDGWSVKRAIREMVLSRAYGLSSRGYDKAFTADGDNRLLWRFTQRRLQAEAIRDALLAMSGQLDFERPAGSASLTLPNLELGSTAKILAKQETFRYRSVYLPMLRASVPEMLNLFDLADPSLVTGQRDVTTVAPQALFLMNSKFVMDHSRLFAERLLKEDKLDDASRVDLAYRMTLSRRPSDAERTRFLEYLRETTSEIKPASQARLGAWAEACQALFGAAEFRYVH